MSVLNLSADATPRFTNVPVRDVAVSVIAGAFAMFIFDAFGQWLSPALGYSRLAPVPLAQQSLGVLFGPEAKALGGIMHYITGMVFYPLAYLFIALPIARKVLPAAPWLLTASVYGAVLWVFALYVMAHLVAGNPAFLGFGQLTWVALVGHIIYGLALGLVVQRFSAPVNASADR